MGSATVVVMARRSGHPFGRSFRLYALLAAVTVVLRVVFRIIFGGQEIGHVLLDLPEIPLPDWAAGVRLLGPVTSEALLAGLYDGLRLATIILCVGAANSLANPKRLLASVPPALYEIGTALVVAVTIFPQLADSARRVRAAQALRGGATTGVGRLRRFLVPVLEDALERSLALAAGMDTRGYGRSGRCAPRRAVGDRLAAARRPHRHLRGDVRLARPHRAAGPGPADARRRRRRRGARPGQRRPPRAAHPLPPRPVAAPELVTVGVGIVVAVLGWYVGHTPGRGRLPGRRRRCRTSRRWPWPSACSASSPPSPRRSRRRLSRDRRRQRQGGGTA